MNTLVLRLLIAPALTVLLAGCLFQHTNDDVSIRPETAIGTQATIMMPGQGPAPMTVFGQAGGTGASSSQQSGGSSSGSSTSSGTSPGGGASSGAAPGAGGEEMALIGGAVGEGDTSSSVRSTPIIGPILSVIGYPFWVFRSNEAKADRAAQERAEKYGQKRQPGQAAPRTRDDAERMRLEQENEQIRQQLAEQRAARGPATISDELAALERSLGSPGDRAPTPLGSDALDRNHDGRPDLWAYRERGHLVREELDDNHDGVPDRILHYDELQRLVRSEEDLDGNGSFETVTHYREGEIARRRADSDDDGQADGWSFYDAGELVRHEVDRDKDGFRDLVMVYEGGALVREEDDRNHDGRPDLILRYENGAVVEKHEDVDFDGLPDVSSYYENGKLVRRTVSSETALDPWSEGTRP